MIKNISTVYIQASKEVVWNVLTKPELVKRWQYNSDLVTSWEVGSDINFSSEWNGVVYKQWGKVLELVPLELIRYSLFAPRTGVDDKPENYFVMNYVLTGDGENTKLEIIQEDDRPSAKQELPQGEENPALKGLKEIAENG